MRLLVGTPPPPALIPPVRTIVWCGLPLDWSLALPAAASETLRALTCAKALVASTEYLLAAPRPFQSHTDQRRETDRFAPLAGD